MMQQYLKELQQCPFDPSDFVEGLARRVENDQISLFEPLLLHETFLQAIKDLELLQDRQRKKCQNLELICKDEEFRHWQDISNFQEKNKEAMCLFQELDERINFVATKVIHLGDQLESVNTPRSRAFEAQKLMLYFAEFQSPGLVHSEIFTQPEQLFEAADVIQKLHVISQELPSSKFEEARKKISIKYDEIERNLIEEFVKAQRNNNVSRMKEIASILSHFKGYSQCIDAFIEHCQMGTYNGRDLFNDILPLTERSLVLMKEVFSNSEQVLAKFVLNIYHLKLQKHIKSSLSDRTDLNKYLKNLLDLYSRTKTLSVELMHFKMGTDDTYLNTLTQNIFQKHLDTYISHELKYLKERCSSILQQFYDSKHHQKKQFQAGGFQDLRRDLQAVIGTRANINIAQIEDYGGETFLSEEVVVSILQEAKDAFHRCSVLSKAADIPSNAYNIFDIILTQVVVDYVDYAVELALQAVPIPESRSTPPPVYFFHVVYQANSIIHLVEKHFIDHLVPLVISLPAFGYCETRKRTLLSQLELKLENGIDRSLNAIVGWVKLCLQNEQKKTDFKPESDIHTLSSSACLSVVQYIHSVLPLIQEKLDGKNLEFVLTDLGCRFHKVIYEHLLQFQYNSAGAMCVICDMNEYRKCARELNSSLVNTLFDTLHALCNLLLVKPENLYQVCSGGHLAVLERSILMNFIQLRADFKNQKLSIHLKGFT